MLGIIVGIIVWVIFLVVCINIGKEKNRNGFLWGFFFGPLGLLILAILPKIEVRNTGSSSSYSAPKSSSPDASYVPTFMRKEEKPVSLSEMPKITVGEIEEKNTYYDNDLNSKKWICGKCGTVNKTNLDECKKCGNKKGLLKMNN